LGDLDGPQREAEPDADPRHRESEQEQQSNAAEEFQGTCVHAPTDREAREHEDDQDPAVVDDVRHRAPAEHG